MLKIFTRLSSVPALSTPGKLIESDILNGVPLSISSRSVRIFKPAKSAMQSGLADLESWRLDFEVVGGWTNPLMGWASTGDPVNSLNITFKAKEDAVRFAERHGYDYWVDEPKEDIFKAKVYADNFKYSPTALRYHHTK